MYPTVSPHGANYVGAEGSEEHLGGILRLFKEETWTEEELNKLLHLSRQRLPRLISRERLEGYLRRKPNGHLPKEDQRRLVSRLPLSSHKGLKAAAVKLFSAKCHTIRKFLRVWTWIDTCLALAFKHETPQTTSFKMKWWIIVAHDVASSNTIHYACKKWGTFSLYITLYFGGAVQPLPKWEAWFPALPEGTWLRKEPGSLTLEETALCRILSDKRGLPAGDSVSKQIALSDHLQALTKGDTLSYSQEADLRVYSEMAANSVLEYAQQGGWFRAQAGHVSLSNSACFENTRDCGGKRTFILSCLSAWLMDIPDQTRVIKLPTGEYYEERKGFPRWKTVKPPGSEDATDIPAGIRVPTGILTDDFKDGEPERIGFQLFSWSFSTLVEQGYLDSDGRSTGKPMPVSRVPIGEPGCKVRVATKSIAAFIVYGQPFAHAMRELLEHHPALRAGLSSGYQLFEWLKIVDNVPKFVMVGDFDAATDHIQHRAGRVAMRILLRKLGADLNGYGGNFVDLLLSPRVIEEDGIVTITNSGCLMGEPGTKIVLTFLALVANCYARRGPPSTKFATAGDDQIDGDDEVDELLRYAEASKVTTMVPSEQKWGIFRYHALYCQQLLNISERDPLKAEIPVPKPRLLSPESKTGRGDNDTNPAYGKASQLARECSWCQFDTLKQNMIALFLRNMGKFIEKRLEVFLAREWGGLGLPGVDQDCLYRLLPQWHQSLIAHREFGMPKPRRALANWSTPHIMSRGLLEADEGPFYDLISEFLPTVKIEQLDLGTPANARFRERLKAARKQGWVLIDEVVQTLTDSSAYQNLWDLRVPIERGFSSVNWSKRSQRLEEISKKFPQLSLWRPPKQPSWQPGVLCLAEGVGGILQLPSFGVECDLEDGQIGELPFPIMGHHASPRVFLHYDNNRLLLNATSR